ncbi:aminotransferase class V-fold PLP-dependent enzyme [Clostridium sp. JN-9]|uniref:aminotransferase class V-fold PLP-dependent enzyme n=1 Tax=Clostridium sp. JN-9 TaxID=2507159 RepID=UPI001FAAB1DF|nr:aminotransferase class V-fold PLP-dependent enzyme [Clostridium sp. JN-9]
MFTLYYMNLSPYRNLIVGVDEKVPICNGSYITSINFDNAATTPPFITVMDEINNFSPWYSSIHRGTGYKSEFSSNTYENCRKIVLQFVNADLEEDTAIFVKNTTEAINLLCCSLWDNDKDLTILTTKMEHHSNDLPWRNRFKVIYAEVDRFGRLKLEDLEDKLKKNKNIKLVSITGASNVTGCINPIHKIAKLAHSYGAKILVDGAQLIPHKPFSMKGDNEDEKIDFSAFSAHKMYAPFGTGVLIGPKEVFQYNEPHYRGGGTVKIVTDDYVMWDNAPNRFEAGTPNIIGAVALAASIKTLNSLGMNNISNYEDYLLNYASNKLKSINGIELIDVSHNSDKVSIIPFNVKDIHHSVIAGILSDKAGIAVRSGCFCAQPYVQRLLTIPKEKIEQYKKNPDDKKPGFVRLSFGLYNDINEIDRLVKVLQYIISHKRLYDDI